MEDERRKKRFEDLRIKFMETVTPVDLLPHLDCLTKSLKEQVDRWQDREGPQRAAFRLAMELVKKDNWYPDLLYALRYENHSELADGIEGIENRPRGRGSGPRPHDGGHDGGAGGGPGPGPRPEPGTGPGPDDGTDDNGNDGRKQRIHGEAANTGTVCTSNSSPSSNSTGPVSGQSQPTSQLSSRKTKPIKATSVNTPLKKLPCHYQSVVERLNIDISSLCILAGQLDITSEEFNRIQHTSNPTREVLNLWIQSLQTEEVTLQDLLVELYAIKRIDIITDLLAMLKISDWNPPEEQDSSTPQHAEEVESCGDNSPEHATHHIVNDENRKSQHANPTKHGQNAADAQQNKTSKEEVKIKVRSSEPEVSACSASSDQEECQSSVANNNGASDVKAQPENETVEGREHETVESAATSSTEQEQRPRAVASADSADVNKAEASDSGELDLEESIASDKKEVSNVAINVNTPTEENVFKLRNLGEHGENIVESVTDNTGPTISGSCNTVNDESQFVKNEAGDSSTESKSDIHSNDNKLKTNQSVVNMEGGYSTLRSYQTIVDNSDKVATIQVNSDAPMEPGKSMCISSFWKERGDDGEEESKLSESSPGLAESSPVSNSTASANSSVAEPLGQVSNQAPDAVSDKIAGKVDSLEEMRAIMAQNSESVNSEKQKEIESKRITVDMARHNNSAKQQKPIPGSQDLPYNQPPQILQGDENTDTNSSDKSPSANEQEHVDIVGPDSSAVNSVQSNGSRWPQWWDIAHGAIHQIQTLGNTSSWVPN